MSMSVSPSCPLLIQTVGDDGRLAGSNYVCYPGALASKRHGRRPVTGCPLHRPDASPARLGLRDIPLGEKNRPRTRSQAPVPPMRAGEGHGSDAQVRRDHHRSRSGGRSPGEESGPSWVADGARRTGACGRDLHQRGLHAHQDHDRLGPGRLCQPQSRGLRGGDRTGLSRHGRRQAEEARPGRELEGRQRETAARHRESGSSHGGSELRGTASARDPPESRRHVRHRVRADLHQRRDAPVGALAGRSFAGTFR